MEAVGSLFRKHPELEPTGKLSILGAACCSAERMNAYVKRRNPQAPEIAELYLRQGKRYGVRGDVAFCQMVYETRCWKLEISGPPWSPMVLSQWSEESSIEVQMQLLYTFATGLPLPQEMNITNRQMTFIEQAGWRGTVPCWEDLSGKWSGLGNPRYGQDIVAMWRSMLEWRGKGEVVMDRTNRQDNLHAGAPKERNASSVDWSSISNEQMKWLQEQQLLPFPAPHPDRKVTWAELAVLLHRWENRPPSPAAPGENNISS